MSIPAGYGQKRASHSELSTRLEAFRRVFLGIAGVGMLVASGAVLGGWCATCRAVEWFFSGSTLVFSIMGLFLGGLVLLGAAAPEGRLRWRTVSMVGTLLALPVGLVLVSVMVMAGYCVPCVLFWCCYGVAFVVQARDLSSRDRRILVVGLAFALGFGVVILAWRPVQLEAMRILSSWQVYRNWHASPRGLKVGSVFPLEVPASASPLVFVITDCNTCTREVLGSAVRLAGGKAWLLLPEGVAVPEESSGLSLQRLKAEEMAILGLSDAEEPYVFEVKDGKVTVSMSMSEWVHQHSAAHSEVR